MSVQALLQDLKTIKKTITLPNPITTQIPHQKIAEAIISSATKKTTTTAKTLPSVLSTLTPNLIKLILSDPYINTHKCLSFFNIISQNRSLIPFKIEIEHYATVIRRAIKSKKIEDVKNFINSLSNDAYPRYPFPDVASLADNRRFHPRTLSKLFNKMVKVCSDSGKFDTALETFSYMRNNGIEIHERTCCIYLIALIRSEQLGLCLSFFYKMMEFGIHVSVYSLAVVVDGLCANGEIKRARELVQEAICKSIKPNVVTFNSLINACCKRWNFEELDLVLLLMEEEMVELNVESYRLLIDGFLSGRKIRDAERMIMEMHDKDLKVEIHLWNSIVRKYCKLGKMESAFQVFDKMTERSVPPNAETYRILVSGICGIGEMDAAKELADGLLIQGVDLGRDVFSDLISGWCKKGEFGNAVGLLSTMERKGLCGDVRLYNMVIVGLCESNRVEEATRLLSLLVKCGASLETFHPFDKGSKINNNLLEESC